MSKSEHSKTTPAGEHAPDEVRAVVDDDDPAEQSDPGAQRPPSPAPYMRRTGAIPEDQTR